MPILLEYPYVTLFLIVLAGTLFAFLGMMTSVKWTKKVNSKNPNKVSVSKTGLTAEKDFFSRFEEIPEPDYGFVKKPDVINLAQKMDEEKNNNNKRDL